MQGVTKIVLAVLSFITIFVIFSVTISCVVNYYQLNNSAKAVLQKVVGIDDFRTHTTRVHSWFMNPEGSWHMLLDKAFDVAKTKLPSDLMKTTPSSDISDPDWYIQRMFRGSFVGYNCYSGYDLKLGPGSICDFDSPGVCNVIFCAKQGDRNVFVTVTPF